MRPAHPCPAARSTAGRTATVRFRPARHPDVPAAVPPRTGRSGGLIVWLPWLCAPAFALLPIAGCGLAETLRAPAPVASGTAVAEARPHPAPLLPGPRDPQLVRIGAVMPTALPRR